MRPFRFSIQTIFVAVTLATVTFAVLFTGSEVIEWGFEKCATLFVGLAPIRAYYTKKETRAFWLGAACMGISYEFSMRARFRTDWPYDLVLFSHSIPVSINLSLDTLGYFLHSFWLVVFALLGGLIAKYAIYRELDPTRID